MLDLSLLQWMALLGGAGLAGWVDAVIGGGGLILIPIIMAVMPGLPPVVAIASNKVAAVSGTASAGISMARKVPLPGRLLAWMVPLALVFSGFGATVTSRVNQEVLRPIILVALVAVGVFMALKPSFGQAATPRARTGRVLALLGLAVSVIAAYDGAFGPGTGMFLILVLTAGLGQDFLKSTAMTKVLNSATNIGSLVVFILAGHVWWTLGLTMAVFNIAGAQLGARTVLNGGTRLVRWAMLALVVALTGYLGWQQLR